jgi:hypothetical protein
VWHSGRADGSASPSPLSHTRARRCCAAHTHRGRNLVAGRSPSSSIVAPSDTPAPLAAWHSKLNPPPSCPSSLTCHHGYKGSQSPPRPLFPLSLSLSTFFPPREACHGPYTPPRCLLSKSGHRSSLKPPGLKPTPLLNPSHGELHLRPSSVQFPTRLISLPPHWCCRLPSPPPTTTGAAAEAGKSPFFHHHVVAPIVR